MKMSELMAKCQKHVDISTRAGTTIIAYQHLFDAAGQAGDWEEMERCREVLKNQIDIQCDAKMAQYRLIQDWKKDGCRE